MNGANWIYFDRTKAREEIRWHPGCAVGCLVVLGMLIASWVSVWLDRPLFRKEFNRRHCLTIREQGRHGDEVHLKVTYHPGIAFWMFAVTDLTLKRPEKPWKFQCIEDRELGITAVYDDNARGFVYLYESNSENDWIVGLPTDEIIWNGESGERQEGYWEKRWQRLRERHPELPYATLPRQRQRD
ncbi:MAG: hypothetical protein ACK5OB_09000 [Pirellula sp.]